MLSWWRASLGPRVHLAQLAHLGMLANPVTQEKMVFLERRVPLAFQELQEILVLKEKKVKLELEK